MMAKQRQFSYRQPMICLTHNTVTDTWFPTFYELAPGYLNAYQFRYTFVDGFNSKEAATEYMLREFRINLQRHSARPVLVSDQVFQWDGNGKPDPGLWVF